MLTDYFWSFLLRNNKNFLHVTVIATFFVCESASLCSPPLCSPPSCLGTFSKIPRFLDLVNPRKQKSDIMQVDIHAKVLGQVERTVSVATTESMTPAAAAPTAETKQSPAENGDSASRAISLIVTGLMMFVIVMYQYVVKIMLLPLVARIAPLVPQSLHDRAQSVLSSKGMQKAVTVIQANIRTYTNLQL
jgi:hypothetical protein